MSLSIRKAALALHGISAKDRAWIMERLPKDATRQLISSMDELSAMGADRVGEEIFDLSEIQVLPGVSNNSFEQAMQASQREVLIERFSSYPLHVLVEWANEEADWVVAHFLLLLNAQQSARVLEEIRLDRATRLRRLQRELKAISSSFADLLLWHVANDLHVQAAAYRLRNKAAHTPFLLLGVKEKFVTWARSFVPRR